MKKWRGRLSLFAGIVWRRWHDGDRIGPQTAWTVANIVYP